MEVVVSEEFSTVRFEQSDDGVGWLTLTRPEKRNAQSPTMWTELYELGKRLSTDDTLRGLVVRGEGKSFSAGIDLAEGLNGQLVEWAALPPEEVVPAVGTVPWTFTWIRRLPCVTVAAVQGHAFGAGFQLALACDLRLFADNARVGLMENKFGLLPDMGATEWLPAIVGEGVARELILLGDVLTAEEAHRIGLANTVVPAAELAAATEKLARRIAALPPLAVAGAKRAVDLAVTATEADSKQAAVDGQVRCLTSADFQEARAAFAQGRPARFTGQ